MPERQSTPGGTTAEQDAEAGSAPPARDGQAVPPSGDAAPVPSEPGGAAPVPSQPDDTAAASSEPDATALVPPRQGDTAAAPGPADAVDPEPTGEAPAVPRQRGDAPPVPAEGGDTPTGTRARPRWRRRALLATIGVVAALALLYVGDLVATAGSVQRGVTVEGIPVGGLALNDAAQTLRAQIEPRTKRPVPVVVGDATGTVDPVRAGLSVDWPATLALVGDQPLDPVTRVASFFRTRELGVVTRSDPAAVSAALDGLGLDRATVEGDVRFDGVVPRPVAPVPGRRLDVPAATAVLTRDWVSGGPVALPLAPSDPVTTLDDVNAAVAKVAAPAVSGPVTITGEKGTTATLAPKDIAAALKFRPERGAGLVPTLDQDALVAALKPQLVDSETPGQDATLDFTTTPPVVVPSVNGRGVDYPATSAALLPVLTRPGPRTLAAVYGAQAAAITTDELGKLGISGIIGEFTTRGFAADSGANIKRAASQINGAIVRPGATFSLNAATNPRDAAHGYVDAGIIEDGHAARGIGGGVSQVATTLYNAAYFAGMTDVEHKEHSFYISRYPAGREATVFDDVIDLKFRNDNPTAVVIQTQWAPGSITVRIYGTKRYDVTSASGPRTDPTAPKTVTLPQGDDCSASKGAPGFTVTNTRTLKDVTTGQVRTETRTVKYNPSPIVVCDPG